MSDAKAIPVRQTEAGEYDTDVPNFNLIEENYKIEETNPKVSTTNE